MKRESLAWARETADFPTEMAVKKAQIKPEALVK